MARILILFASSYGQTRDIAWTIERHLRRRGHAVDLVDVRHGAPEPGEYDLAVIGSRVELGRHARAIRRYVHRHAATLAQMPSAFFSVSMSAADGGRDPSIDALIAETGWHPGRAVAFAGALPYTRYNPFLRFVIKRINAKAGHATDTTRDHEFTDWAAVRSFAEALADAADRTAPASRMPAPPPAPEPHAAPPGP
ncbi:MAG TPA: flavodoxin domain-containing protein [Kofleriaceae bacterium]|nr:flavodoxin domain-containing protein [Kofleriaceae bacterium]